jgi:hypothetical protein
MRGIAWISVELLESEVGHSSIEMIIRFFLSSFNSFDKIEVTKKGCCSGSGFDLYSEGMMFDPRLKMGLSYPKQLLSYSLFKSISYPAIRFRTIHCH